MTEVGKKQQTIWKEKKSEPSATKRSSIMD